jgi:ABC-type Fe3+-hydroxamate transport system substrate-binding protein
MLRGFTDMMGRKVEMQYPPKRIVSVVPSQTELLYHLGLNDEVVGITKFCVHPEEWFRNKMRIGGTKQLHIDKIRELQPDLIIANKEENTQEQIEELAREFPVWVSDIESIERGVEMIERVGELVGRETEAKNILSEIKVGFSELQKAETAKRVAYFIWYRPWMSAGGDTFISDMLRKIGWVNVFEDMKRYPEVSLEALKGANPEVVLLSSEPYPFKEKHIVEIKEVLPDADVWLVDGEMFSWYGSRMRYAADYMKTLL